MGATRKLQGEIDRVLKKVQEGVDVFDGIWNKVYDTDNANQKEKYEGDLKKEIKKLQRYRDQIKTWIQSSEIKDKKALIDARKQIEREMERFKVCEKETKTKAFSKEGLGQHSKLDPKEKARTESREWLNNMASSHEQFIVEVFDIDALATAFLVAELESQIDSFESEMEGLQVKKGKQRPPRLTHLEESIVRHKAHINKLEMVLRLLDNDELQPEQVADVKDLVEDYVERNQDDFDDFEDVDDLYQSLPLEKLDALESLDAIPVVPTAVAAVAAATGMVVPANLKPPLPPPPAAQQAAAAAAALLTAASSGGPSPSTNGDAVEDSHATESAQLESEASTSPAALLPAHSGPAVLSPQTAGGLMSAPSPVLLKASELSRTLSSGRAAPISSAAPLLAARPSLARVGPPAAPAAGVPGAALAQRPKEDDGAAASGVLSTQLGTRRVGPGISSDIPSLGRGSVPLGAGVGRGLSTQPPHLQFQAGAARTEIAPDQKQRYISRFQQVQQQGVGPTVLAAAAAAAAATAGAAQDSGQSATQDTAVAEGQHQPGAVSMQVDSPSLIELHLGSCIEDTAILGKQAHTFTRACSGQAIDDFHKAYAQPHQQPVLQPPGLQPPGAVSSTDQADKNRHSDADERHMLPEKGPSQQEASQGEDVGDITASLDRSLSLHDDTAKADTAQLTLSQHLPSATSSSLSHLDSTPVSLNPVQQSGMAALSGGPGVIGRKPIAPEPAQQLGPSEDPAAAAASTSSSSAPATSTVGLSAGGFGLAGAMPPLHGYQDQIVDLRLLEAAFRNIPQAKDSERPRSYTPRNPTATPSSYPQAPASIVENPQLWERLDTDVLFFAFYYQQGMYQQYLAAKELKRQSWRYHKKYNTWFQRHDEPKHTTEEYEQGTYVYFDFHIVHDDSQTGWCQRIKTEFTFEYSFLEDELV
eukprot:SM000035S13051  [mRNA]  locus=s35:140899:147491:+ [translate_table: standard]